MPAAEALHERRVGVACALGGFLLIGAVLAPSLAGRKAFLPADYWLYTVPFALAAPPALKQFPTNLLLGDQAVIYAPQFWVVREGLRQGALPLWNPYFRTGEPLLGTGLAGPWAPTNLPILVLPWPLGHAWAAWLRFGLMWLGGYLFARALRLDRGWSLAVAIGFCFAPGFIVHFQQQPRAVAHMGLPWLLWGAERLAAATRAGLRAQLRASLVLVLAALATLVAGYPPAEFNVVFGAACYLALRLPWRPLRAAVQVRAVAALALLAGAALAAPVLLPFTDFLLSSATFADRTEQGQWVLPAEAYRLLWDPLSLGSPLRFAARPWTGASNFEEEQLYIGLAPWLFLIAGAIRLGLERARLAREDALRVTALAFLCVTAASLGFGWPPLHAWLTRLPPFSFATNPRLLFLAQVGIPVMAALVWRNARRSDARPRPAATRALLAGSALAAVTTAWLALHERWELRSLAALASAAGLVAAAWLARPGAERRAVAAWLPFVLLADVAPIYAGYHPQVPRAWADPARARAVMPPPIAADPAPRVAIESFAAVNLAALYGVEDIRGYGYPVPGRYDAYMREVAGLENPHTLEPAELARPEVIGAIERTCARWLLTSLDYDASWSGRLDPVWRRGRLHLYALRRASPCASWYGADDVAYRPDLPAAVARLHQTLDENPEEIVLEEQGLERSAPAPRAAGLAAELRRPLLGRIEVEVPEAGASRAGWIVVRESYDPGWRARSESGRPLRVVPAQVRFLAVEVPAGTRSIALDYVPPHSETALVIAGAALAAVAASQIWARRRVGRRAFC